jgi:hypothetical protein
MSASIYDNLRQPGIYDQLDKETNGDERDMRRAVLARLRLDDLLTNDSLGEESRMVWSISDTLDGRLFTVVPPTQLKGINFEIFCHPDIAAADPEKIVPMVLASWIHDEDGNGKPGGFLAVGERLHRRVAQALGQMSGLNVTSLTVAREVARNAGIPQAELEKLVDLWERWDSAIRNQNVILKPWGAAASGEPLLRRFLRENETNGKIPGFGLTEVGTDIFRRALDLLAESSGRRDSPIKFLLDQIEETEGRDKDEACEVHRLFMHYTFSAIARSNRATPEFTVSVGECDSALSGEDLDRIESVSERRHPVNIDPKVVSGLGHLDVSEYEKVKDESASQIRAGIEKFIQSEGSELERLHGAMDFLAKEIGETSPDAKGGFFRTVSIGGLGGALGAAGGLALDFFLAQGQPAESAVAGGAIGGVAGPAVESAEEKRKANRDFQLLKKSLIRTFEDELRDRANGHITYR